MPAGSRVRGNNALGTITDSPLSAGATSFNSALLPTLPAVLAAHAVVTFDPLRQYGNPEIAIVTAHSAGSTTATIVRGAYGTTPRNHPYETVWIHAPVDEDLIEIVTSATRPTDPYQGQMIFESDNVGFRFWTGSLWSSQIGPATTPVGSVLSYAGAAAPSGWLMADGAAVSRTTYDTLFGVIGTTYGAGNGSTTFNVPDLRGRVVVGTGQGPGLSNRTLASTGGVESVALSAAEAPAHSHLINNHTHSGTTGDMDRQHTHAMEAHRHWVNGVGDHTHNPQGVGAGDWAVRHGGAANGLQSGGERTTYTFMNPAGGHDHGTTGLSGWHEGGQPGANTGHLHPFGTGNPSDRGTDSKGSGTAHTNMQPWMALHHIIRAL